jgi:hypothetical protein
MPACWLGLSRSVILSIGRIKPLLFRWALWPRKQIRGSLIRHAGAAISLTVPVILSAKIGLAMLAPS